MRKYNDGTLNLTNYGTSLVAAKAKTIALEAATLALNTAISMGVSFLISKAISAIDNFIHREERLAEAAETAGNSIKSSKDSFDDLKKTTGEITKEYAKLAQGVNQVTGKNDKLSTEDYERFLELSNQLAKTLPNVSYTIDENGNKIVNLKGNVDEITDSINNLIKSEQLLTNQDIDKNMGDVFEKALGDLQTYSGDLEKLNLVMTDTKGSMDKLLAGESLSLKLDNESNIQLYNELKELFKDVGLNLNAEFGQISLDHTGEWAELTEEEIAQLEAGADRISHKFSQSNDEIAASIQATKENIQSTLNGLSQYINSWLTTSFGYQTITETYGNDLGTAMQNSIDSINWANVDGVDNWNDAKKWIEDNILNLLKDADNEELRDAYLKLFSLDTSDLPLEEAKKVINSYLDILYDYMKQGNETKEDFKERLGFDDSKNDSLIKNVQGKLQDKFDAKVSTDLTENELKIAANLEIDDGTLLTWDQLIDKIKKAKEEATKSDIKSWKSVWNSSDFSENKEKLLELAEAGKLSPDVLSSNKEYAELLKTVGGDATIAAQKINELVQASDQLSAMKAGISSISDVLAEKKDNLSHKKTKEFGIGADTFSGFDAEIKGLDSWEQFEETLGNGKSSMEQCQKVANKLATEWVNSNNFLSQLDKTNQDYYISTLKEMGVKNAEAVVTQALAKKEAELGAEKKWNAATSIDLAEATAKEIDKIALEKGWSDKAKTALYGLALQKNLTNSTTLDFSSDITAIIDFVEKIGVSTDALKAYQSIKSGSNGAAGMPSDVAEKYEASAQSEVDKALKKLRKPVKVDVDPSPTSSGSGDSKSKKDKSSKTKSTQVIDWISRRLDILQSKIDLTKAKFENLYKFNSKKSNLNTQISQTTKLLNAQSKAATKYQKKANSIKLSSTLKNKVRNGQITGSLPSLIATYGEAKAEKIQKFQDYWDKYKDATKNVQETTKALKELRDEQDQLYVDRADQNLSTLDAEIEIAGTAKTKNTLEQQKLKWIKQSYSYQIKIAERENNSAKIAELRAQKEKEILETRKQILQNTLDENESIRSYADARYENATTISQKNKILDEKITTYSSDKKAYTNYLNALNSGKSLSKSQKEQYQYDARSTSTTMKLANSSYLTVSDKNKILNSIKSKKAISSSLLQKVANNDATLYNTLLNYMSTLSNQEIENAAREAKTGLEQTATAKKEALIEKRQNLVDQADANYNLNQQLENNAKTAEEKNKYEAASRKNIKESYKWQIDIARINKDITTEKRLQAEEQEKLNESYKKEFDNVKEEYDNIVGLIDAKVATTQAQIAALEAQGRTVSTSFYEGMIQETKGEKAKLLEEEKELQEKLNTLSYESPAWYQAKEDLEAVKQNIYQCDQNTAEWQKTINELDLAPFQLIDAQLESVTNHLQFLVNMLSHKALVNDEIGGITGAGLATLSLSLDQLENNREKIKNIQDEWAKLNEQVANGTYVGTAEELQSAIEEYSENVRSAIEANADLEDSIKSLVENALNSLKDALDESISKMKEALQNEKDLYDYQRKVQEQTKSIANIQKQIAALTGDQSEETRAKLQTLKIQLEDAEQNLKDTEYDRYISDQEKMLDDLSDDFQDFIEDALNNTDELIEAVSKAVEDNPNKIANVLSDIGLGDASTVQRIDHGDGSYTMQYGNYTGSNYSYDVNRDGNVISTVATTDSSGNTETNAVKSTSSHMASDSILSWLKSTINYFYSKEPSGTPSIDSYIHSKTGHYITESGINALKNFFELPKSNGEQLIGALKKAGFSSGGIVGSADIDSVLRNNGDDVIISAKVGERVLNPVDSKNFERFNSLLPDAVNAMNHFVGTQDYDPTKYLKVTQPSNNVSVGDIIMHIDGSKVNDAGSLVHTIKTNRSVQRSLSDALVGQSAAKLNNRLGI